MESQQSAMKIRKPAVQTAVAFVVARPWWLKVIVIATVSILFMQFFGMAGTRILAQRLGWSEGASLDIDRTDEGRWYGRFARWDSGYYLRIIETGYRPDGAERAFYPLYPMLVAGVRRVSGLASLPGAALVSMLAYILACLYLYRWVLLDHPPQVAWLAVAWLAVFPLTFFLIAAYAESLLLLTCIASLYYARKGNFLASGFAIMLAGATRPYAFLLGVPFLIEFFIQRKFDRSSWLRFAGGAALAPLGMVSYFIFLAVQSGSYNLVKIMQSSTSAWSEFSVAWPWVTWFDGLRSAFTGSGLMPDWFSRVLVWHDLLYAIFGLVVAVWAIYHLRPSLAAFSLVSMLFFYTNHGPIGYAFWSLPRHVAFIAPVYLTLALWSARLPGRYRWPLLAGSAGMLALLSAWFASGRWVS